LASGSLKIRANFSESRTFGQNWQMRGLGAAAMLAFCRRFA